MTSSELAWCLQELAWLEKAQSDDRVTVEEWRRRGNALLARSGALQGQEQDRYHAAWEAFQRREGTYLPPVADTGGSSQQALVDQEAQRRIAEVLEKYYQDNS